MIPVQLARRGPWYSAAQTSVATPNHIPSANSSNRFNDGGGTFQLRYLAATPHVALREATALHGSYATGFVASHPPRSWTLYRYDIITNLNVVDFTEPSTRNQPSTTIQELTGDWLNYLHQQMLTMRLYQTVVKSHRATSPTQELAYQLHGVANVQGFLVPSAKLPLITNLVLFFHRLPLNSIRHLATASIVV